MNRCSRVVGTLALTVAAVCSLAAVDELQQTVQVTKTEHIDFPSGGTVNLRHSIGNLMIEGWDQPGVEITTVKSTKAAYPAAEREKALQALDQVKIEAEPKGSELVITTKFPTHPTLPPTLLFGVGTGFDLVYYIKVPGDSRLMVDHDIGDVHVDDVSGDIHATTHQGLIALRLPENAQYSIDAKSDLGSVTSDFPGTMKDRFWFLGHRFTETSAAPHKLYLRVAYGDVIILKIRQPPEPK